MYICPWAMQRQPQLLAGQGSCILFQAMQMLLGPCSNINKPLNLGLTLMLHWNKTLFPNEQFILQ